MKKLRKTVVAVLSTVFAISCVNISAFADMETGTGTEIVVPVKIDTSATNTVNGFIATIKYNPDDITPVLAGKDILGDGSYAVSNIDRGYLVSDKVSEGTLIIGWADKDFYSLEDDNNVIANITFEINSDSTNKTTEINTTLHQVARYSDVMADEDEYFYSDVYDLGTNMSETDNGDNVESGSSVEMPDSIESGSSVELVE